MHVGHSDSGAEERVRLHPVASPRSLSFDANEIAVHHTDATPRNSPGWNASGQTDPGKKRENNEDRILCDADRGLFVVADGMGGEAAGEIAAQQAVESVDARLRHATGTPARRLREAIATANNEIYRMASEHPEWGGMACVLTAALIEDGILHVGHVGDSRLYRIQRGEIRKVTHDHSPVGVREDAGELSELEAMRHPRRNEVYRDVGSRPHNPDDDDFIESLQFPFVADAAWVLCSDGLSDMLTAAEIMATVLSNAGRSDESVRGLISRANAAGGKDNISVIVIEGPEFARASAPAMAPPRRGKMRGTIPSVLIALLSLSCGVASGWLGALIYTGGMGSSRTPVQPAPERLSAPALLIVEPGTRNYPSIAKALESARSGDRIEIADGEYQEAIRLKDGVEIFARTPGRAVLRLTRALPNVDAAITAEGIAGASIAGLIIEATPGAGLPFGVRIENSDVSMINMEVSGAVRAGILVTGASRGSLSANFVHNNSGVGIAIAGKAAPLLVGNLLYGNGRVNNQPRPGMHISGDAHPEVKRNIFSGNGAEAIRLARPELRERMMDNLFVNPSAPARAVRIERTRP